MQNTSPIAGARHARIAHPHHVALAQLQQRLGHRYHAPLRHTRPTLGPRIAQDQHSVWCHWIIRIIDYLLQLRIAVCHQSRPSVGVIFRITGRRLDHCTIRCEVAPQNRQRAFVIDRIGKRPDHIVIVIDRLFNSIAQARSGHCHCVQIKLITQLFHQSRKAACIEEIFHQIIRPGWTNVGQHRRRSPDRIQIIKPPFQSRTSRHGDQVDDGVRGTARGHGDCCGIARRRLCDDLVRRLIFPDHVHNPPPAGRGHSLVIGIGRGN